MLFEWQGDFSVKQQQKPRSFDRWCWNIDGEGITRRQKYVSRVSERASEPVVVVCMSVRTLRANVKLSIRLGPGG